MTTPICWKCGYQLSGLGVDDNCPECGTPVWSAHEHGGDHPELAAKASSAMIWGIIALVLFFACIGPLAGFVAIPAILKGGEIRKLAKAGVVSSSIANNAKAGFICGWIAAGLSILAVIGYAAAILAFGF